MKERKNAHGSMKEIQIHAGKVARYALAAGGATVYSGGAGTGTVVGEEEVHA